MLDRHLQHMIDPVKRVIRSVGVLVDWLHLTPERRTFFLAHPGQVFAPVTYLARSRREMARHQERQRALAAAALPGDVCNAEDGIRYRERNIVHGNSNRPLQQRLGAKDFAYAIYADE